MWIDDRENFCCFLSNALVRMRGRQEINWRNRNWSFFPFQLIKSVNYHLIIRTFQTVDQHLECHVIDLRHDVAGCRAQCLLKSLKGRCKVSQCLVKLLIVRRQVGIVNSIEEFLQSLFMSFRFTALAKFNQSQPADVLKQINFFWNLRATF